jgi:hypothetical protein
VDDFHALFLRRTSATESTLPWNAQELLLDPFKEARVISVSNSPINGGITPTIEFAFATIRHRTKRSKGCLSRDRMLHMMFKLSQCAEQNWRKLRGFDYLAKVITGVTLKDGIETANPDQIAA